MRNRKLNARAETHGVVTTRESEGKIKLEMRFGK
jgi:hypothetical protein